MHFWCRHSVSSNKIKAEIVLTVMIFRNAFLFRFFLSRSLARAFPLFCTNTNGSNKWIPIQWLPLIKWLNTWLWQRKNILFSSWKNVHFYFIWPMEIKRLICLSKTTSISCAGFTRTYFGIQWILFTTTYFGFHIYGKQVVCSVVGCVFRKRFYKEIIRRITKKILFCLILHDFKTNCCQNCQQF